MQFLADCDWAGKTVVPFMTHEGNRMGRSEGIDIWKLCAGATLPRRASPTAGP